MGNECPHSNYDDEVVESRLLRAVCCDRRISSINSKKEDQLMRAHNISLPDGETIFVGIDMHQRQWRVTIRTDGVELTSASIPGDWQSLRRLLERYPGHPVEVVYEAGCFGYWLHDHLVEFGARCIVTPPSLIPRESGNRVKTDKRDSRKLALLLAKGM